MEVLVGPTFSIGVSSPSKEEDNNSSNDNMKSCIFLKDHEEEDEIVGQTHLISTTRIGLSHNHNDDNDNDNCTDSSSSIGAPDDSDEEEVDSGGFSKGALCSLESLEDSLPTKRGLSNHFSGKSKSFTNLSEVSSSTSTVKDLGKPENPFNKRRRILMANKWSSSRRKSSFYSWSNPKSMPLLSLPEEEDDDDTDQDNHHHHHRPHFLHDHLEEQEEEEDNQSSSSSTEQEKHHQRFHHQQLSRLQDRRFKTSFKSHSCFALSDMQEEEEPF